MGGTPSAGAREAEEQLAKKTGGTTAGGAAPVIVKDPSIAKAGLVKKGKGPAPKYDDKSTWGDAPTFGEAMTKWRESADSGASKVVEKALDKVNSTP